MQPLQNKDNFEVGIGKEVKPKEIPTCWGTKSFYIHKWRGRPARTEITIWHKEDWIWQK